MGKEQGYIRVYRGIFDDDAYKERFSPAAAWIDLLLMAEYEDGKLAVHRGIKVELKRGQLFVTNDILAKRWCWENHDKVQRFINKLIKDGQLIRPSSSKIPVIEIVNYDTYQCDAYQIFTKVRNKKSPAEPINTDNSEVEDDEFAYQKFTKVRNLYKENIYKTMINARTRENDDLLFAQLTQETEWLDLMAMHFFSDAGDTRDAQLQALYAAIKQLRKRFLLDGQFHADLQDLKRHIRMAMPTYLRLLKEQNERTTTKNNQSNGNSKTDYSKRKGASPSDYFTDKL